VDEGEDDEDDDTGAPGRRARRAPSPLSNSSSGEEPEEPSDAYKYQRRRSRAVLYQLSGTYGKHKTTKGKLQLNKVSHFDNPDYSFIYRLEVNGSFKAPE